MLSEWLAHGSQIWEEQKPSVRLIGCIIFSSGIQVHFGEGFASWCLYGFWKGENVRVLSGKGHVFYYHGQHG